MRGAQFSRAVTRARKSMSLRGESACAVMIGREFNAFPGSRGIYGVRSRSFDLLRGYMGRSFYRAVWGYVSFFIILGMGCCWFEEFSLKRDINLSQLKPFAMSKERSLSNLYTMNLFYSTF